MTEKKYMFVVTACDGRHEHKSGTFEEDLQEAADWHRRSLGRMITSSFGFGLGMSHFPWEWEGMDGQITRIEVVGEYDAFMKAEFGDDDD